MPQGTLGSGNGGGSSGGGSGDWRQDVSQLPSFYSPRTKAADVAGADAELKAEIDEDISLDQSDDGPSRDTRVAPPGSLLSPAFTPPATPGTNADLAAGAVPSQRDGDKQQRAKTSTAAGDEPRGVPVDSSIPTGGCGTKRPRLMQTLPEVQCIVRARIPTTNGTEMFLHLYSNNTDSKEHLAIVFGSHLRSQSLDAPRPGETEMDRMIRGAYTGRLYPGRTTSGGAAAGEGPGGQEEQRPPPLVRIHSECYTGETAWSARCDCGEQLDEAARLLGLAASKGGGGIIIYLRQEGRGIGLGEKLKAYNLQDLGSDTVEANLLLRHPADARSYGLATAMLMDLGQTDVRLLTNNPDKIRAVEGPNREVRVTERVAMVPLSWKGTGGVQGDEVQRYIETKVSKMGHLLDIASMTKSK